MKLVVSWIRNICRFAQVSAALPSVKIMNTLLPSIAQVAQGVYNEWEQDEDGIDPELGSGGICQDIADKISEVLGHAGIDCTIIDNQGVGEQHVWVVAKFAEGVYEVDIEPGYYETGGGYNWKKRPNVVFRPDMIHIGKISNNPMDFDNYAEAY